MNSASRAASPIDSIPLLQPVFVPRSQLVDRFFTRIKQCRPMETCYEKRLVVSGGIERPWLVKYRWGRHQRFWRDALAAQREVKIQIDDSFTAKACNFAVGFL